MTWTTIYPINENEWHSLELRDQREQLNKRIEQLLIDRNELDCTVSDLEEAPIEDAIEEINNRLDGSAVDHHRTRVKLLQTELQIRKDLIAFYKLEEQDRRVTLDECIEDGKIVEQEIHDLLVEIGYRPMTEHRGDRIKRDE